MTATTRWWRDSTTALPRKPDWARARSPKVSRGSTATDSWSERHHRADATGEERYAVKLTPTGFEVAQEQVRHEREAEQGLERNRLQHSFNRAIALLTLGLVTINMFDSAIQITLQTDRVAVAYIVLLLGFGGMIVVLAGVVYSGLLSSYSKDDE
ncbi:MAG: hypothetical protein A07HN63_02515 [uncultured archaeon A07HN63]|nr:MAG: hypothetical protein A07HN63_02515 [uncultured archaeon A07HN63]